MTQKRYFVTLSYLGTKFSGWQKQPKATSVQEVIEKAISKVLRTNIEVVGCGRTDAGVHAKQYFLHFDFDGEFPQGFLNRMNKVLPPAIAFHNIFAGSEIYYKILSKLVYENSSQTLQDVPKDTTSKKGNSLCSNFGRFSGHFRGCDAPGHFDFNTDNYHERRDK